MLSGEGTFAGMPALQQLILSSNRLTTLTSGSFDSITQLTTLDLSDNQLSTIGAAVFQNLNKLFWLDLSGNQLNGLPKDAFYTKISNVLLQGTHSSSHSPYGLSSRYHLGNPLVCNESIDWLVQYLVSNNVRTFLPNQHDVRCAGNASLERSISKSTGLPMFYYRPTRETRHLAQRPNAATGQRYIFQQSPK